MKLFHYVATHCDITQTELRQRAYRHCMANYTIPATCHHTRLLTAPLDVGDNKVSFHNLRLTLFQVLNNVIVAGVPVLNNS